VARFVSADQSIQQPQDNGDHHGKAGVARDGVEDSEKPLGLLLWDHAMNACTRFLRRPGCSFGCPRRCVQAIVTKQNQPQAGVSLAAMATEPDAGGKSRDHGRDEAGCSR
jgi:hypothetical protein